MNVSTEHLRNGFVKPSGRIAVLTEDHEMTTAKMFVTPEMAANWLQANTRNRPINESKVRRIASDIREGRWIVTHQGIAFDRLGTLLDGQHRLHAIVLAGIGVWINVTRNASPESMIQIDSIEPRTAAVQLTLIGEMGQVNRNEIATLRAMLKSTSVCGKFSISVEAEKLKAHRDAIAFTHKHLPTAIGKIVDSMTRAVIARAYYSVDHEKLARFCAALTRQAATTQDEQVVVSVIRSLVSSSGGRAKTKGERYGIVQRGLYAFVRGEYLAKIYPATQEHFPLPEETEPE